MRPLLFVLLWLLPQAALADDDLITIQSAYSAPVTVQRLQEALTAQGWTVLATVDHAAQVANQTGIKMPARTTILFAFVPGWVRYLLDNPTIALDGPSKLLVWEDQEGVWVTRNSLQYVVRHILRKHEAKRNELRDQAFDDKLAALIDNVTR
jgi:uncharacterized protein (DUF302 family)